jgi:hypothetical protein
MDKWIRGRKDTWLVNRCEWKTGWLAGRNNGLVCGGDFAFFTRVGACLGVGGVVCFVFLGQGKQSLLLYDSPTYTNQRTLVLRDNNNNQ